jgi:hypothetical protein
MKHMVLVAVVTLVALAGGAAVAASQTPVHELRASAPPGAPVVMPPPQPGQRAAAPFKYVIDINGGLIEPEGPMREWKGTDGRPLFSGSPWVGFNFGITVGRYAQIDLGFDVAGPVIGSDRRGVNQGPPDAARRVESPISDGGFFRFPFGVRGVIPLVSDRVTIGVGGGGAILFQGDANDAELTTPDGDVQGGYCAGGCVTRYGVGGYGLGRVDYRLGRSRRIGLGVVATYTQARLSRGEYLSTFTASETRDGWFQVAGSLSIRVGG